MAPRHSKTSIINALLWCSLLTARHARNKTKVANQQKKNELDSKPVFRNGGRGSRSRGGWGLWVFQGPACCVWVPVTPPKLSARLNSLRRGKDFFLVSMSEEILLAFQTKSGKLGNLIHICRQRIPSARLIKLKYAFLFGRYFTAPAHWAYTQCNHFNQ